MRAQIVLFVQLNFGTVLSPRSPVSNRKGGYGIVPLSINRNPELVQQKDELAFPCQNNGLGSEPKASEPRLSLLAGRLPMGFELSRQD